MAKVEAPNKDYNGPGPGGVTFEKGVAEVEDEAALAYYRRAGYRVSGKVDNPVKTPEPQDPREVEETVVGTRLRDAAVDPQEGDFLAPINAGKGNPHGSTVVAPEIHATGPKGIRPGDANVGDAGKHEAREKAFAEARLVNRETADEANKSEVPDSEDRGDLGLSDPGSAKVGKAAATKEPKEAPSEASTPTKKATASRPGAKKS